MIVEERCEKLAGQYPFPYYGIYCLYLKIETCDKEYKLERSMEDRFDILQRILEIACIHAKDLKEIVRLVYSKDVMKLFTYGKL